MTVTRADLERWRSDPAAFMTELLINPENREPFVRALGFEDLIGRLAPGYKADIVLLDLNHVNFLPLNDPINQLVHTEDGSAVDSVIINGEVVLWQGRFTRIDIASVRSQIDVAIDDLARLSHEARQLAEALEDHVGQFCMGLARQPYHVHAMAGAAY